MAYFMIQDCLKVAAKSEDPWIKFINIEPAVAVGLSMLLNFYYQHSLNKQAVKDCCGGEDPEDVTGGELMGKTNNKKKAD
jgi:hypothetical protein